MLINVLRRISELPPRSARQSGMSLLEVVVTLFLVGILLMLMTQSGVRMFERWQSASTERDIRNQLNALPMQAFVARESQTFETAVQRYVELPVGWRVQAVEGLKYLPSGVCNGGQVSITSPRGQSWDYMVEPPRCDLRTTQDAR